jgi:hypothetical protein
MRPCLRKRLYLCSLTGGRRRIFLTPSSARTRPSTRRRPSEVVPEKVPAPRHCRGKQQVLGFRCRCCAHNEKAVLNRYIATSRNARLRFRLLPRSKLIVLGVVTDDEVAHVRHGRFAHTDFATQFLNLRRSFIHRGHADVIRDRVLRELALQYPAVARRIIAPGVDQPVRLCRWARELVDLPAKQFPVKTSRPLDIVRRDFEPDDAGRCAIARLTFRFRVLCTHRSLSFLSTRRTSWPIQDIIFAIGPLAGPISSQKTISSGQTS